MALRSAGCGGGASVWTGPTFPRPVRSFAGRRAELDRLLAHLGEDVLFFVHGVPGIGKTELVYQLMSEARQRAEWAAAIPIAIAVEPGATMAEILASLLAVARPAADGAGSRRVTDGLEELARQLEARSYLVFVDDAHHLPQEAAAEALRYLARHVQRSRLFLASRREIVLPPDAPPPVVTLLGPLDPAAAEAMAAALAGRLQQPRPDATAIIEATHGSPAHVHRALTRSEPGPGPLEAALAELSPAAGRLLRALAVALPHRPAADAMMRPWPDRAAGAEPLRELTSRFFIEPVAGQVLVPPLVANAVLAHAGEAELVAAHADAAELCLAALESDAPGVLALAIEAANHHLAAGRPAAAWAVLERWHAPLFRAGSEELLIEPLERVRPALPSHQVAIDLLIARCLVRASRIEDADRALARVSAERTEAEDARFLMLRGQVAQAAGELERADELLTRAVARAPDPQLRLQAHLHAATAAIFAGDTARARGLIDDALAALPVPTPRQRARAGWARAVSWMCEERFERAALEARRARAELAGAQPDLAKHLAMIETLACIESEQMLEAREAARSIDDGGIGRRMAALYRAILRSADGEASAASRDLSRAFDDLATHGDAINACLAGYYGSAALAEIGKLGEALALAERTEALARRAGLRAGVARVMALRAMYAAEAVQSGVAHRLAREALSSGHAGPRSSAKAHCAHARAYTIEGDIALALAHVAEARAAVGDPELAVAEVAIDVEQAAIELVGGNLERAVERAERAIEHYRGRSRDFQAAHALIVLAAAYLARGRRTDLLFAERAVAQARELADVGRLRSIQVACAILAAALARRERRDRAARELLVDALRDLDPERGSLYAGTLLAAIDGGAAARAAPGAVALLAHLGFSDAVYCYLIDQHGRRAATEKDVARERELRELFVDEIQAVIVARGGAAEIHGRPMLCTLLSALVQARGEPLPPDVLYKRVWGASEYHPLQHRNTLYVAINRLRRCLREALPGRELIARANNGWRLVDPVDACVAVPVRKTSG